MQPEREILGETCLCSFFCVFIFMTATFSQFVVILGHFQQLKNMLIFCSFTLGNNIGHMRKSIVISTKKSINNGLQLDF